MRAGSVWFGLVGWKIQQYGGEEEDEWKKKFLRETKLVSKFLI